MRISHKINHGWAPNRNDPAWEARVEREAEATTNAAERAYKAAQKRLAKALERRDRVAKRAGVTPKQVALADQIVELRRQELLKIERMMTSHPAPSKNRGSKSFRPVPYADRGVL